MNFKFFSKFLDTGLPTWTVIQNWVLRFGLYKLQKPLPKRDDWIWIMDHTIEFGQKKCLLVLAVSLEVFKKNNCQLKQKDLEVGIINIEKKVTGEQICQELQKLKEESGTPIQIVADGGSDIKKGVRLFKEKNPTTIYSYDITHKSAILLKHYLNNNERWQTFSAKIGKTKNSCMNTEFVYLAPKKSRDKSRWQNLDQHLFWAEKALNYKKNHKNKVGRPSKKEQKSKIRFKNFFNWIEEFEDDIKEWRAFLDVTKTAQAEIKLNGLSKLSKVNFEKKCKKLNLKHRAAINVKEKIKDFFIQESASIPIGEKWIGTSDIIESVFGKYKIFSAKTPLKEVGKTVLTIPVLTSEITAAEVKQAMETISCKDLNKWIDSNLGKSLFSKRKQAFSLGVSKNMVKKVTKKEEKEACF